MCFYGGNMTNARAAVLIMSVITFVCGILSVISASRAFGNDYFVFA